MVSLADGERGSCSRSERFSKVSILHVHSKAINIKFLGRDGAVPNGSSCELTCYDLFNQ